MGSGSRTVPSLNPGGWNRFAIEVSDLDSEVARLKQAAARFRNNIVSGVGGKQMPCASDAQTDGVRGRLDWERGGAMRTPRIIFTLGVLLLAMPLPAAAQATALEQDSARAEIRSVLRAFYLNLANQNWDALAAYVLSPKLLERRGAPGDVQLVARDRTRGRGSPAAVAPRACPSSASPMINDAVIGLDGDWADVYVPRCSGPSPGVDQFGMLYFEERWRFIYTDLFGGSTAPETARR